MCGGYVSKVLCAGVLAFTLITTAASAAEPSFSAHGSAEQVYVTGLAANQQMSLLNASGQTIATQAADSLGGLLFRNVPPGSGYRVRATDGTESDPLTVLSTQPTPPSTDIYNQSIPSSGYGYLTTRDGTKLAIYVHPPQDVANALPVGLPLPRVQSGPTPTLV